MYRKSRDPTSTLKKHPWNNYKTINSSQYKNKRRTRNHAKSSSSSSYKKQCQSAQTIKQAKHFCSTETQFMQIQGEIKAQHMNIINSIIMLSSIKNQFDTIATTIPEISRSHQESSLISKSSSPSQPSLLLPLHNNRSPSIVKEGCNEVGGFLFFSPCEDSRDIVDGGWDDLPEAEDIQDNDHEWDDLPKQAAENGETWWSPSHTTQNENENLIHASERQTRTVHFHPEIVTEVRFRPFTPNEDMSNLYFSCHELQKFRDLERRTAEESFPLHHNCSSSIVEEGCTEDSRDTVEGIMVDGMIYPPKAEGNEDYDPEWDDLPDTEDDDETLSSCEDSMDKGEH